MKQATKSPKRKLVWVIVTALLLVGVYYLGTANTSSNLFVDPPPTDFTAHSSITDSAICSFKKVFNISNGVSGMNYSYSNDDPKDTISFTNLSTGHPTVVTNTGQSTPTVIYDDGDSITMVNAGNKDGNFVTYRLYRKEKILVYEDVVTLIVPQANLEMGYCH